MAINIKELNKPEQPAINESEVVQPASELTSTSINDKIEDEDVDLSSASAVTVNDNQVLLNGDVEINDSQAPIVVLFGPTSCGKTMTLIRLTRYLREHQFTITPDRTFRPSYDTAYKEDCEKFNQIVNDPIAQPGTSGYMLVDVISNGRTLCKILEAPGEYYFNPVEPNKKYQHYLNKIIDAKNRKVWCVFLEPEWMDANDRANYCDRITALRPEMKPTDRMVFIFNKIDKLPYLIKSPGVVNEKHAIKYASDHYNNIFDNFKNDIPIINWFKPYNCFFLSFQTGRFTAQDDSMGNTNILYSPGDEAYPSRLWKIIRKSI